MWYRFTRVAPLQRSKAHVCADVKGPLLSRPPRTRYRRNEHSRAGRIRHKLASYARCNVQHRGLQRRDTLFAAPVRQRGNAKRRPYRRGRVYRSVDRTKSIRRARRALDVALSVLIIALALRQIGRLI